MRSVVGLALACAALTGCGADSEGDGYPDAAVESFVGECAEQQSATEAACRCVIRRLQISMPYEEFERADEALREDRTPESAALEKLEQAARGCLGG